MSAPWKIADVLDFEALLEQDDKLDPQALGARDRALYTESIAPALGANHAADRPAVILAWVRARRDPAGSPGESYTTGWQTLVTVSALAGVLIGGSLCAGLLRYSGEEPINAFIFLASTLGPQFLVLSLSLLFWLERRTTRFLSHFRPIQKLISMGIGAWGYGLAKLPAQTRNPLQASLGRLNSKRHLYGPLLGWSLLIVTQVFAVAFNLGILSTLLIELPARDLRFGWQTTLHLSSETAATAVQSFSAPWSWAPNPAPSPTQILSTRYAPGQSHHSLPPEAMRAWWPFLAYSILFYGLLPRSVFCLLAIIQVRRQLKRLPLVHPDANPLWRRLTGPLFRTPESTPLRANFSTAQPDPAPPHPTQSGTCFALIADELVPANLNPAPKLTAQFGWKVAAVHSATIDQRHQCAPLFAAIESARASLSAIALLVPANRDPIVAIALFLKALRQAAGPHPEILLFLLSEPSHSLDPTRLAIWRQFRDIHQLPIDIQPWP